MNSNKNSKMNKNAKKNIVSSDAPVHATNSSPKEHSWGNLTDFVKQQQDEAKFYKEWQAYVAAASPVYKGKQKLYVPRFVSDTMSYHEECKHFYAVPKNTKKERDIKQQQIEYDAAYEEYQDRREEAERYGETFDEVFDMPLPSSGNCLVCQAIRWTPKDWKAEVNKVVLGFHLYNDNKFPVPNHMVEWVKKTGLPPKDVYDNILRPKYYTILYLHREIRTFRQWFEERQEREEREQKNKSRRQVVKDNGEWSEVTH